MVINIDLNLKEPKDTGEIFWKPIMDAFEQIETKVNENADELKAVVKHNTTTISYAMEGAGQKIILGGSKHLRGKITNAYIVVGDNVPHKTQINLVGISDVVSISETEGCGKCRIFKIVNKQLHFIDAVVVNQTGDRRIIITFTIESLEEGV